MAKGKMTDAQARAYIRGEQPFDEIEYFKEHAERLYKGIVIAYREYVEKATSKKAYLGGNLKMTALHYLEYDGMQYNKLAKDKLIQFINNELAEFTLPEKNDYSKDGKYHNLNIITA